MRSVVVTSLDGPEGVSLAEHADPEPAPGEVLIDVHAVAVNYVDLLTMSGRYQFHPELPYVPGKGPAGVVLAVGPGVESVRPGERVLATAEYGGYAERAVCAALHVYPLPEAVDFVAAASMSLAYDTAWMALRDRANLAPGDSVLVLGATGAVGRAAITLAKAWGATTVLGGVSGPDRAPAALAAGADAVVDLSAEPVRDRVHEPVAAITGGGVDVVIDPVGGAAFEGAVRALAWRGRLVVVGFAAGDIPVLRVNYLLLKNIAVSGLQISDYRRRRPDLMAQCFDDVWALASEGRIGPGPARTRPLAEWRAALDEVASRSTTDRIVLLPQL